MSVLSGVTPGREFIPETENCTNSSESADLELCLSTGARVPARAGLTLVSRLLRTTSESEFQLFISRYYDIGRDLV